VGELAGVSTLRTNYAGKVSGTWQPIDVGFNGAMISGTSPDKSMVVTVVLCTEGKALVNLQFDSASNDPIDSGPCDRYRPQARRRNQGWDAQLATGRRRADPPGLRLDHQQSLGARTGVWLPAIDHDPKPHGSVEISLRCLR
jgi:hypothetical protein